MHAFPDGGPSLRWKTAIGAGYGGPAVANGRVFVMDRVDAGRIGKADLGAYTRKSIPGKERVVCLNESTGAIIWKHS